MTHAKNYFKVNAMNTRLLALLSTLLIVSISGCTFYRTEFQMYNGNALPSDKVAFLIAGDEIGVMTIDSFSCGDFIASVNNSQPQVRDRLISLTNLLFNRGYEYPNDNAYKIECYYGDVYEMLPGTHIVTAEYNFESVNQFTTQFTKGGALTQVFDAQPGNIYVVSAGLSGDKGSWYLEIKDIRQYSEGYQTYIKERLYENLLRVPITHMSGHLEQGN